MTDRVLTALFDNRAEAELAISDLQDIGVPLASITVTGGEEPKAKGFWESLGDMFFPEDDREAYAESLRRGGWLVTVTGVDPATESAAVEVLEEHEGAVDLDSRVTAWRDEGWTGVDRATRTAYDTGQDRTLDVKTGQPLTQETATSGSETVIPIVEERLRVGKRDVSQGKTRVRTYTVETPVEEGVNLREQHVVVEQRVADRPATAADVAAATENRVIEAEDRTEEAVVEKTAHVVGEVAVKTEETARTETVTDTVKKTKVDVDDTTKKR